MLATFAAAKAVKFDTLDPDCFWHLRVADQLVADGIGPLVDRLSFSARTDAWTPYSWLAELAMRAVWRAGGYRGAVAAQAGLQASFALLLAGLCVEGSRWQRRDGDLGAIVATAVGLFASLPYLSFRPVTFALVLLAVAAWLTLHSRRTGGLRHWWAVPITAVLANVHLYALLVPAAAVLFVAGEALAGRPIRRWIGWTVAVALASAATPMLPGVIRTAWFYGHHDPMVAGPVIAEMRPWGRDVPSVIVLLVLLGGSVRAGRRVPVGAWLWAAAAAALTLTLGRFAPLLAIAACPPLAAGLGGGSGRVLARRGVRWGTAAVAVACLIRVAVDFPSRDVTLSAWLDRLGPDVPGYPCAAADFVADRVPRRTGRLLNEFTWGGYLGWRLGDRWRVLLDGRTQVFPADLWRATYLGTDADRRTFLARQSADAAVVPARHSLFRQGLLAAGWTVAHRDPWAEVLVPPAATAAADVR